MSMLGKRKREGRGPRAEHEAAQLSTHSESGSEDNSIASNEDYSSNGSSESKEEEDDLRSIFARHFNKQFRPLTTSRSSATGKPKSQKSKYTAIEDLRDDESDDANHFANDSGSEDFSGFDDDEDTVQVVEHSYRSDNASHINGTSARDKRAFMSSKPPSSSSTSQPKAPSTKPDPDDQESQNLKNDLALQRLLSESHLLQPTTSTSVSPSHAQLQSQARSHSQSTDPVPTAERNLRHKTTDLRLAALGAHTSILTQQKMPAAHLRGIRERSRQKEALRRKEAKENGVILERPSKNASSSQGQKRSGFTSGGGKGSKGIKGNRTPRGIVGDARVGKFSGATLRLSRGDLQEIKGSGGFGGRGARRGGMKQRGSGGRGGRVKKRG